MSILLIGVPDEITEVLVPRLVSEGDEVRVLERDEATGSQARRLGAFLATGPLWDADLIERAAQNVRTIVVGNSHSEDPDAFAPELVDGARRASRDMRLVLVDPGAGLLDAARASALDFVVIELPKKGLFKRSSGVAPADIAEAIDAADDIAGNPRLEIDLGSPEGWRELRVEPPGA